MSQITWEEALNLIAGSSKFNHSLLVSQIMATLAEVVLEDEIEWRLVGLLHDLDYDETRDCIDSHGKVAAEALKGKLSDGGLRAIISHDHRSGVEPQTLLDESLIFADSLAVIIENRGLDILADTSS